MMSSAEEYLFLIITCWPFTAIFNRLNTVKLRGGERQVWALFITHAVV